MPLDEIDIFHTTMFLEVVEMRHSFCPTDDGWCDAGEAVEC